MTRKEANLFAQRMRWWAAPVRCPAATLALLRKSVFPSPQPASPWVRQTPNGIRV